MDVKEAVAVAKDYVGDLYAGEEIADLGLEEVEFDDVSNEWSVTIGFLRPWNRTLPDALALARRASARSYKVLRIDDDSGEVKSLKDRILAPAQ
ncbi:MAG: hypothetical protein F4X26_01680 [Chloroflexi bacterium]|nr:hypothetical protein [Chloroflexota bacterium]